MSIENSAFLLCLLSAWPTSDAFFTTSYGLARLRLGRMGHGSSI